MSVRAALYHTASGEILAVIQRPTQAEIDAVPGAGEAVLVGTFNPLTEFIEEGAAAPRPDLPAWTATGAAPLSIDVTGHSAATTLKVVDQYSTETTVAAGETEIEFTEAGVFTVVFFGPFPWIARTQNIEVT